MTATNFAYLNMFHNFNCYMERLGFKYLTVALELHTHYYLNRHGLLSYYLDHGVNSTKRDDVIQGAAMFGDFTFNKLYFIINGIQKIVYR